MTDHNRIAEDNITRFLDTSTFADALSRMSALPKSSWLFVTRNRCPFEDPEQNPLVWAFQTLISNKLYSIDEFIVIDDCSFDYTKSCIDWLVDKYGLRIRYEKNERRVSCSESRRIGLLMAKNSLVFMGDDDCIYSEHFLVGSILTYTSLQQLKPKEKVAVLNLPVYERDDLPRYAVKKNMLGKVELERTFFYHEFDKFPLEYLSHPEFLDQDSGLLLPILVETFKGVNLSNRELVIESGNYLDLSMWATSFSEHIELSYRIAKLGYKMYHQSDPRISCIHLRYGERTLGPLAKELGDKRRSGLRYSVGEMVALSEEMGRDTGGRLDSYGYHLEAIGSLLSFYLKISENHGVSFIRNQHNYFVKRKLLFGAMRDGSLEAEDERRELLCRAIELGIRATEVQTKKDYRAFRNRIDRIRFY